MITDLIVLDDAGTRFDASEFVTSLSVSLTADAISQLTIRMEDPFLDMLNKNIWQIRRKVTYLGGRYEVAAVEVMQGAARESLVVEARSEGCQRLKRDKGQASFGAISPTAFAKLKADEFGLRFFGEPTPAKKTIIRAQNDKVDESSWTVLRRLADEYDLLLFETDNTLFFASESFLLGKFAAIPQAITVSPPPVRPVEQGNINLDQRPPVLLPDGSYATVRSISVNFDGLEVLIPTIGPNGENWDPDTEEGFAKAEEHYLRTNQHLGKFSSVKDATAYGKWVSEQEARRIAVILDNLPAGQTTLSTPIYWINDVPANTFGFKAVECPTVRTSDDNSAVATLSLQLERDDGRLLRPGMTINLVDIPQFNKNYIVTEVRWNEHEVSSISVAGRTPEEISSLYVGSATTLTRTI